MILQLHKNMFYHKILKKILPPYKINPLMVLSCSYDSSFPSKYYPKKPMMSIWKPERQSGITLI